MSQPTEVEQLRALLDKNEREKQALIQQLSRAQAQNYANPAASPLEHTLSNSHMPSLHPPFSNNARSSSSAMSRSATNDLQTQAMELTQDQSRPMKRSKTTHAAEPSAMAPMMRSKSTMARAGTNPGGPVGGPLAMGTRAQGMRNSLPAASSGSLAHYQHLSQSQFTPSTLAPDSFLTADPSQSGHLGRELNVADFLSLHEDELFPTTSPINIPSSTMGLEQYPPSSYPSLCGSMMSGPTLETAPMSRCNSSLNDTAISNQFSEMVRIQSQQSARSFRPNSVHMAAQTPLLGKRPSEDSGVAALRGDLFPFAYPSSAPTPSLLSQHQHAMEVSLSQSSIQSTSSADVSPHDINSPFLAQHLSMERSISRDSIKSNASLKARAKEALARQNYAAKSRLLQPKPAAGTAKLDAAPSTYNPAGDGNLKAAIAKTKYERPKHPKVMCNQCNDHPEGFRGEHELRRHTEAKHKSMVKKWVCRDPDLYGIPHSETAVKPLKDCKQCSQNKQYGAYYNAAAHLRRTHFKVKPRKGAAGAKNGQGKADDSTEKRGGKGGGDWPSMAELKLWMMEVTVSMDQAGALGPDGTDSVGAVDAEDYENEFADSQYASQAGLPMPMGGDGFDVAAFAGVGGGFGQAIDLTGASFHGDLDSQLSDMYQLNNAPVSQEQQSLHGGPISSAGFDYRTADPGAQQQSMAAASLMSLDTHGYTSPVSSTATITQAGAYMDQMLPAAAMQQGSRDDLPDLTFDLTFTMSQ